MSNIKVRTHVAYFIGDESKTPYVFINVTNSNKLKPIRIVRIWNDYRRVRNQQRRLPVVLQPGKQWETWCKLGKTKHTAAYAQLVYIYNNSTFISCFSKMRKNVPKSGIVPNGK